MKDDFYKDIEHKRASKDVEEAKNEPQKDEQKQTMKRSDRHRAKLEKENEKKKQKQAAASKPDKKNPAIFAGAGQKLKSYFNRENLEKGKVFFAGKLSAYNRRFKDEVKVSKAKLSELRSRRPSPAKEGEGNKEKKGILPILLGGALLLPVTIILFVMIISNFWPSGNNGTELAGAGEEDTEESSGDQTDGDVNEDLESQKAEKERELAEQRENESGSDSSSGSDSGQDLGTGELASDYSEEERSELEEAASSAIEEKESGEDSGSDTSEVETSEEETTEEPTEEQTSEQPAEEQTEEQAESEESTSGGATHVVSAEDNLYRIAIRYYGSGSSENVNKIMDANGVTPDSLSVGQELVIPE
ncbi:hypothetical protein WN59_01735 [Salinicoccus sediminis]|uniref:LysM domain-containing protein n=1 Tax=Salinicoccus sediminis TaxID=1432562 RepID=A0A0M2SRH6_9STAP|nr:LysM peptidoglycan-binding domain-containing protein [Salinicoccus sediminis]KKK35577.1 hypothetical protein WN59_01735 [Salinicoccus sediminis]